MVIPPTLNVTSVVPAGQVYFPPVPVVAVVVEVPHVYGKPTVSVSEKTPPVVFVDDPQLARNAAKMQHNATKPI
jgi:hypothetical protein